MLGPVLRLAARRLSRAGGRLRSPAARCASADSRVGLLAVLFLLLAAPAAAEVNVRSNLDLGELAKCIADSGAVFYGAYWCPVCRQQRESFGEHASALPYVECYDAGQRKGQGMRQICVDEDIRGFPTWIFSDGSVTTGAQSPLALAAATDCLGL